MTNTNTNTTSKSNSLEFLYDHAEFKRASDALLEKVSDAAIVINNKMKAIGVKTLRIKGVGTLRRRWFDTQCHGAGWDIFGWEDDGAIHNLLDGKVSEWYHSPVGMNSYKNGDRSDYLVFANNFKTICKLLAEKEEELIKEYDNAVESIS